MQVFHKELNQSTPKDHALDLVAAVQAASRALPFLCSYTWARVNADVELIALDALEPMTVAIVEFKKKQVLMLKSAAFITSGLAERIEQLDGWELITVDGLIARSATQWVASR